MEPIGVKAMVDCDYEYRYERKKAKPIKMCSECYCDLYPGDKVFVIGNKIYCDENNFYNSNIYINKKWF